MVYGGINFGFYNGVNIGGDEFDYKFDFTFYDYVRYFFVTILLLFFLFMCLWVVFCFLGCIN